MKDDQKWSLTSRLLTNKTELIYVRALQKQGFTTDSSLYVARNARQLVVIEREEGGGPDVIQRSGNDVPVRCTASGVTNNQSRLILQLHEQF